MKNRNTLVLAHYYTIPAVQQLADHVGDSLELSLAAQNEKANRIVFLGVRFMAETAKILNPNAEVILPDAGSTCSLVEQTDITALRKWREEYRDSVHVSYINSSAEHKALSDWIVTSRNVDDIIKHLHNKGKSVIFSPDRNMGAYLNHTYGWNMPLWSAVCEVHDQFNLEKLEEELYSNTGRSGTTKYLLAHPESPLSVLIKAQQMERAGRGTVGSTSKMLNWVKGFPYPTGIIYVATEEGLLHNMRALRPTLDIRQAPIYSGCQCNSCPYMKLNSVERALAAINEGKGVKIDYLSDSLMDKARTPIVRMLKFSAPNG
jgi:quinolinate synthase